MKIAIVNSGSQMGGVQRIATDLANRLAKSADVSLIDFSSGQKFFYPLAPEVHTHLSIPPLTLKRKILRRLCGYYVRLTRQCYDPILINKDKVDALIGICAKEQYDAVILCEGLLTACIPRIKSALPDLKLIAWQHNTYDIYIEKYYKNIVKSYLKGVRQADHVVCLTKNDEKNFLLLNPNSRKIYNQLTLSDPVISDVKSNKIVFAARLVYEQKGLDLLLEIAKRIKPDWKIYVAGTGRDKDRFEQDISRLSLNEKVIVEGNLDADALKRFYAQGSLFISTSRWEGFGLVITEAMAAGLPVISFDNAGPAEILDHGKYGQLIAKYDLDGFAEAIDRVMEDESLRHCWQARSLRRAAYFEPDQIIKQWTDVLKSKD